MPPIEYHRYENLAALLAEGQTETEAARLSGFVGAAALDGIKAGIYWPMVLKRVDEIRAERSIVVPEVVPDLDPDTDPDELTVRRLTKEAWQTYVKARADGLLKPALSALELIGKFKGVFVHRQEVTFPSLDQMPPAQLRAMLIELEETEYEEVPAEPADESTEQPAGFTPE